MKELLLMWRLTWKRFSSILWWPDVNGGRHPECRIRLKDRNLDTRKMTKVSFDDRCFHFWGSSKLALTKAPRAVPMLRRDFRNHQMVRLKSGLHQSRRWFAVVDPPRLSTRRSVATRQNLSNRPLFRTRSKISVRGDPCRRIRNLIQRSTVLAV